MENKNHKKTNHLVVKMNSDNDTSTLIFKRIDISDPGPIFTWYWINTKSCSTTSVRVTLVCSLNILGSHTRVLFISSRDAYRFYLTVTMFALQREIASDDAFGGLSAALTKETRLSLLSPVTV